MSVLPRALREPLLRGRYFASHPTELIRHRARSHVLAGPGFLGFAGGVFNPGVVETADGGLLLLCKSQVRHWLEAVGPHHRDYLVGEPILIRLDRDLRPVHAQRVAFKGPELGDQRAIEDLRLFRLGEEIWCNFNVITTLRGAQRPGYTRCQVTLARFDPGSATLHWQGPPDVDLVLQPREKNWVFVEDADGVVLFYGLNPYRVLRSHRIDGSFHTVAEFDGGAALGDVGGYGTFMSYSTNPVIYDQNHWLVLVHQVDPAGMGRLFYHWAVLIERQALRPVQIGRRPLLSGIGARGRLRGALYATAVVIRGEEVLIFHGEGDSHVSYTRFRRDAIDRDWSPFTHTMEPWPQAAASLR